MTPGIPGTGIGGLFYILSALFMPVAEIFNRFTNRGTSSSSRLILAQFSIAVGILLALAVTAWFILPEPVVAPPTETENVVEGGEVVSTAPGSVIESNNVVKFLFIFGTLGVLSLVLFIVQVLRYFVGKKSAPPTFPLEARFVASEN